VQAPPSQLKLHKRTIDAIDKFLQEQYEEAQSQQYDNMNEPSSVPEMPNEKDDESKFIVPEKPNEEDQDHGVCKSHPSVVKSELVEPGASKVEDLENAESKPNHLPAIGQKLIKPKKEDDEPRDAHAPVAKAESESESTETADDDGPWQQPVRSRRRPAEGKGAHHDEVPDESD
jgi:hypothetical protein